MNELAMEKAINKYKKKEIKCCSKEIICNFCIQITYKIVCKRARFAMSMLYAEEL